MTDSAQPHQALTDHIAQVLGGLGEKLRDLPTSIFGLLSAEVTELSGDGQLEDLLNETVSANVETWFTALRHDIPIDMVEPPAAALEHARRMAQRAVPANFLLRAYRLGHQQGLRFVIGEIRRSGLPADTKLDLYEHITRVSFGYIDWVSEQVLSTYQDEYAVWEEDRRSARTQIVRDVLGGATVDVAAVSEAIRYPLGALHVAVVFWWDDPQGGDRTQTDTARAILRRAADAVGAYSTLYISVDSVLSWAWIAVADQQSAVRIRWSMESHQSAVRVAAGAPLTGTDGFRRSHSQAKGARDLAIATKNTDAQFISATDAGVALCSLLLTDFEAMRAFVSDTLGPLANRSVADRRLRETTAAFLRLGSSFKAAAEELHLHANTVRYRIERAIERRGSNFRDDRLDVEVALLLCELIGSPVLRSDTSGPADIE
ncbi:PucR family transcriptional regulator [Mycolicibacterium arenosum]|uniref:Helix-turn-helix domain-containing protein n=1 Tax=Mycolicibacterium arenosum TaxID=2952157 RepID=A0ABT1LW93_9MYCO|nr:helix-turn-helix domain-containing protein [Mycolicibacterium sp. CAU 1645]MCP9271153.1 helix-turn-helix domain-containing protein [Mycolicibacterium sp. CAU 1645]